MRQKMHLLSFEGHRFLNKWRRLIKGTNLRVNALFRYECAPSSRNLPTLCIIHEAVPHYRGKNNDSFGKFSWFDRSYKGTKLI